MGNCGLRWCVKRRACALAAVEIGDRTGGVDAEGTGDIEEFSDVAEMIALNSVRISPWCCVG